VSLLFSFGRLVAKKTGRRFVRNSWGVQGLRIASWGLAGVWLIAGNRNACRAQNSPSPEHVLAEGKAALLERQYARAIRTLKQGLQRFPNRNDIRVLLGRAYLLNHQDVPAIALFREALRREPANRLAKLELGRALGYRHEYKLSDELYRELLNSDAHDEAAATGLASNLLHQKRRIEARQIIEEALKLHPNSLLLQEYQDRLKRGDLGGEEQAPAKGENRVEVDTDYVSDSDGNHFWRASQRFDYELTPNISNHLEVEERWLRHPGRASANVAAGLDEVHFHVAGPVSLSAGGGGVDFGDGSSRSLYGGALGLHPAPRAWLEAGFSRTPFYPDAHAAQYHLTMEGWHAAFDWQPGPWRASAWWAKQHLSDGNLAQREDAEVLRWLGSPRFAIAAGYRYTHYDFKEDPHHGYFSPDEYQSQLGVTGVSFKIRRSFSAEYMVRLGAQSLARGSPYQFASEVSLRNKAVIGKWEFSIDYFYFHQAQPSGAFSSQAGRLVVAYRF
jgi:tetratricopeptide (TPR) repeat protein